MSAVVTPIDTARTPLAYARRYARLGWHVFPVFWVEADDSGRHVCACGDVDCKSPGKHPISSLVPRGQSDATTDEARIERWWTTCPRAHVGVFLAPSGLVAIDIDPRNGGLATIEAIESAHGALASDVLQLTGGGGEHRVFSVPQGVALQLPGKLGPGVDVKLNGYIVVEPSGHVSGGAYAWEASSDPLEGCIPSPLPDWLRSLQPIAAPAAQGAAALSAEQVLELRSALAVLDPEPHDTWVSVGMALHATGAGHQAYGIWCDWSMQSAKFDSADQMRRWRSFKPRGLQGLSIAWIFDAAQRAGWVNPRSAQARAFEAAPVPAAAVRIAAPAAPVSTPAHLLEPPGVAGDIARWLEGTARKPQPQFSASAALVFCATVLGRRFVTSRRNWPSLYVLHIGKSASGKEHAKWGIERLLESCSLDHLIGPAGYTSESGVLSALLRRPSHLAIVDEFGKVLEGAAVKQNARAASAMKALMEAWSRCDGVLRPQGYSTFGLSAKDADELAAKSVRNPALSLLAMTTPESFFDSVGSAAARDGFLNRFLIVESDVGRQAGQAPGDWEIPATIAAWVAEQRPAATLVNPDLAASMAPAARTIPIEPAAERAFEAFERDCIASMDEHESAGLGEMFGRTCEAAMRLSLSVARSCGAETVRGQDAEWAIDFVRHHAARAVASLRTRVADSDFQMICKQVLQAIVRHGARGCTERDLTKVSRRFDAARPRERAEVLTALAQSGSIRQVELDRPSGRGKRIAWVAVEPDDED